MEFIDLARQQAHLKSSIEQRISRVLEHGQYIMGPEIGELESKLANYVGVKHCISCGNGTDALQMALMALGVGPGDAVFTTTFTFIATSEVISLMGATPVFVDIDPKTFNISGESLERAIQGVLKEGRLRPKAIIPVDLFGLLADYQVIDSLAERFQLEVIEDAAQSFGASHQGRMSCSYGRVATTSFFPAKPLGCYGDGGAIFTNDDVLAGLLRSIRIHGKGSDKYDNVRIGVNSRLDTLQAAILLAKFEAFPGEIEARQRVAELYTSKLSQVVETPWIPQGSRSAWAQYSILVDNRDQLQAALKSQKVPTNIYYPKPLHLQTAYQGLQQGTGSFPQAEQCSLRILSLPMHPYLTEQETDQVVEAVCQALKAHVA